MLISHIGNVKNNALNDINILQSTKVSFMTSLHLLISDLVSFSNTFIILVLSTVRIWSIAIIPFFPLWLTATLVGYFFKLVVIGARTIVFRYLFISLGETMTQDLVFFISLPIVGSRSTKTIAYCFNSIRLGFRHQTHH